MKGKQRALAAVGRIAILAVLACFRPAFAESPAQGDRFPAAPVTPSGWTISFTPYGWLTFITGSSTVKGRTVDVDVNPIQVIEHLDRVPWFSYLEARKGRFAFYNDMVYADLALSRSGVRAVNRGLTGTVGASLGLNVTQFIAEAGGLYEVVRWESGGGFKDPNAAGTFTAIDVLAGARYWYQNPAINFDLAGTVDVDGLVISGSRAIARSGAVDWVDPLIGVRLRRQFQPGQELHLRADIGGFGAGSQFSWNALGAYTYEFLVRNSYTASIYIGYRALAADYTQGEGRTRFEYNMVQHGPVTGLTIRF